MTRAEAYAAAWVAYHDQMPIQPPPFHGGEFRAHVDTHGRLQISGYLRGPAFGDPPGASDVMDLGTVVSAFIDWLRATFEEDQP